MITSLKARLKSPPKNDQLNLRSGEFTSKTPLAVWLQTEKREWMRMMKGIAVMTDSLRVSSAGTLIEYLTTIARLQTYQTISPKPKTGMSKGISPLYMTEMRRKRTIWEVSSANWKVKEVILLLASFWMTGSSLSLFSHIDLTLHWVRQFLRAVMKSPMMGEMNAEMMTMLRQQGETRAYQSVVKSLKMLILEKSMKSMKRRQLTNCTPKTLAFSRRGIRQELMKLEKRTPQKTNTYSLGIVLGLNNFLAITLMIMPRMALVTEERTEAPI